MSCICFRFILIRFRYHKTHGHQTQQLHENGDGTFSIVNPETSAPYPGTLGMEKEKPYKCDVCGKRYKNLNGLKYVSASGIHVSNSVLTYSVAQATLSTLQPRNETQRPSPSRGISRLGYKYGWHGRHGRWNGSRPKCSWFRRHQRGGHDDVTRRNDTTHPHTVHEVGFRTDSPTTHFNQAFRIATVHSSSPNDALRGVL